MNPRPSHTVRWLALGCAVALTATACGLTSSSTSNSGGTSSGGSIGKSYHLSGAQFTVGSKEFTEEKILSYITADALQAAGAKASTQVLTGSQTVRTALTSNRVDMYWEYDGTAWLDYMKHTLPIQAPEPAQYNATASADLTQNHIKWLAPANFSDAYGVAVRSGAPGPLGSITSLSDMASFVKAHPSEATFCGASEFLNRPDGLPALEKAYGFTIPASNIKTVDLSIDYTSVAKGKPCNFAEIFTTDGRIKTLNLKVLTDNKYAFGSYVPALTVRDSVYNKYPSQLSGIFAKIAPKLTTNVIINLNKEVDVDGMTPQDVAHTWMKSNGFIG